MNPAQIVRSPLPWFVAGTALVVLGIIGGHWEVVTVWSLGAVLCFAAGVGRGIQQRWPTHTQTWTERLENQLGHRLFWGSGVAWCLGWVAFLYSTDPDWVPSGIDWHDSYLDAYALTHSDPPLYCAWRYPLYPAIAAKLTQLSGIHLELSVQWVSRIVAVGTFVPLYWIARNLYGRAAAIGGIVLLLTLATYRMHTDAVTPYPMVMFLAATAAAGVVSAARGSLGAFLLIGLSVGGLLANDGKSLLISLGMMTMAVPMALVIPHHWRPGTPAADTPVRSRLARGSLVRAARLLLLLSPIVFSYRWMGALPVKAFTLEEMAVAYLMPGGRGATQAPRNLQDGYMWGHLSGIDTIPKTLLTFYEAGKDPRLAKQNEHQWITSLQRLQMDYPGFTPRSLTVLGLCLLVPLFGRRKTRMQRLQSVLQVGGVVVVLASCWPSIKNDYQERYVVHGAVFLPLLLMGGIDAVARLCMDSFEPMLRWLRGLTVLLCAVFLLLWTGNPISLGTMADRLDPVAMGGLQEYEVGQWGRENLTEDDLLLDTSWMMQALLLAGDKTVARTENSYPPGGSPWPAGAWRFSRPWPDDQDPPKRFFALVNYLAMAPDTHHAEHVPIESLITKPDSPMGLTITQQDNWTEVFRTSDTIVRIYRWDGSTLPPNWQLHRRSL